METKSRGGAEARRLLLVVLCAIVPLLASGQSLVWSPLPPRLQNLFYVGPVTNITGSGAIVVTRTGDSVDINTSGASGEANTLGDAGLTNGSRLSLVGGKSGTTLQTKTFQPGWGLVATNQSTNVAPAVDPSIIPTKANPTFTGTITFGSAWQWDPADNNTLRLYNTELGTSPGSEVLKIEQDSLGAAWMTWGYSNFFTSPLYLDGTNILDLIALGAGGGGAGFSGMTTNLTNWGTITRQADSGSIVTTYVIESAAYHQEVVDSQEWTLKDTATDSEVIGYHRDGTGGIGITLNPTGSRGVTNRGDVVVTGALSANSVAAGGNVAAGGELRAGSSEDTRLYHEASSDTTVLTNAFYNTALRLGSSLDFQGSFSARSVSIGGTNVEGTLSGLRQQTNNLGSRATSLEGQTNTLGNRATALEGQTNVLGGRIAGIEANTNRFAPALVTNTVWVDAGAMRPYGGSTAENGRAGAAAGSYTNAAVAIDTQDFDDTTNECATFTLSFGPGFAGIVKANLQWFSGNTLNGASNVMWEIAAAPSRSNDLIGISFLYKTNLTDRFWSSNSLQVTTMPTLTMTNYAGRNRFDFRIGRLGTNATDEATGDARLVGVELRYVETNYVGGF